MKNVFLSLAMLSLMLACDAGTDIPVMGDYSVYDVNVPELSGLCFNQDESALLACGDKGVVFSVSFEGEVTEILSQRCDMEGISVNPSTGDIYLAVERVQEVQYLPSPDYSSRQSLFAVQEAVEGVYGNDGLEAVEYYKDDVLFVGSQRDANLWQYLLDGTMVSKISLSSFASEIAGICYETDADLLWITDSELFKIFLCKVDGTLLATYDVPFIENAESICVDRKKDCIWVGSDEYPSKLYKIDFRF